MPSLDSVWRCHAEAVVAGNAAAVANAFTPPAMARALLTQPDIAFRPTAFEIRAVGEFEAEITYIGEVNRTMRTTWQETRPGKWQIIDIVEVVI